MTVYFIGAGPGDPELITVKGQRLVRDCPVILYAGSLIPPAVLDEAQADAEITDTAPLNLDEIVQRIADAHARGLDVARLHSGDPSIYGAIGEQVRRLEALDIPCRVIPGVTAASACAAELGRELTLSGVSQTVIHCRPVGKTPMPEGEHLADLGRHGATLAIHLGVPRIHQVVADLIPHYGADCPVAVLYRVTWPDAETIRGTLADIVDKVRARRINRTATILVGRVLEPDDFRDSYLYDRDQGHIYRPRRRPRPRRDR
jgi:precorrin-4/cobalt-precorrin-4 C11-methyltransferase